VKQLEQGHMRVGPIQAEVRLLKGPSAKWRAHAGCR
jgi:hypothetical protein